MGSLGFVNALFLAGLGGALIPLVIHMIERDQIQRVTFGSVRFLRNVSRQIIRRHRMAEIILLALRMAIVAMLAVAFARPFLWPEDMQARGALRGGAGRAVLVLVDNSASMSIGGRLKEAKSRAVKALGKSGVGRVAVASFGTQLRMLSTFDEGPDAGRNAVAGIEPSSAGSDLAGVLKRAQEVIAGASELDREILVISDLHRSAWAGYRGDWKMPEDIVLTIEDVAPEPLANAAILEMAWPLRVVASPVPRALTGKVACYGEEPRKLKLSLVVGDKTEEEFSLLVQPDSVVPIRFRRTFDKPGIVAGKVVLSPSDEMPADDAYFFAVQVVPKVKVLLVNGQMGVTDLEKNDGFFLKSALAPTADSPCEVREVAKDKVRPDDLADADVVVVANASTVPADAAPALKAFIERGGGAIFFLGGNVSPEMFNAVFGEIAPCKLRAVVDLRTSDPLSDGVVIGEMDFTHDVFRIFAAPHQGDFSGARFLRYFQVKDSQAASVLARFEDGSPAVLEKRLGAGCSILLVSSAAPHSPRWNDLSLQSIFLPLLHQMVGRITAGGAGAGLAVRAGSQARVRVADPVDEVTLRSPGGGSTSLKVLAPEKSAAPSEGGRTAVFSPRSVGVYRVSAGTQEVAVAVNLDPGEADPRKQRADEIAAALGAEADEQLPASQGAVAVVAAPSHAEVIDSGQRIWWYILATVLGALVVEMVFAFRTARR